MTELPPEGWYPDPADSGRVRWWDGNEWTEQFRELEDGPGGSGASGKAKVGEKPGPKDVKPSPAVAKPLPTTAKPGGKPKTGAGGDSTDTAEPEQPSRRRWLVAGVALLALLAVGAGAAVAFLSPGEDDDKSASNREVIMLDGNEVVAIQPDGTGRRVVHRLKGGTDPSSGDGAGVNLQSSGDLLAIEEAPESGESTVTMIVGGGQPKTIENAGSPVVAPDGSSLVVASCKNCNTPKTVVHPTDGEEVEVGDGTPIAVFPDGDRVLIFDQDPEHSGDAVVAPIDGEGEGETIASGIPLALSPDGRFILIVRSQYDVGLEEMGVYLWDLETGDSWRILDEPRFRGTFSDDGRRVLLWNSEVDFGDPTEFTMIDLGDPIEEGSQSEVWSDTVNMALFVPGRDELLIARDGQIYVLDPASGDERPLASGEDPAVSTDGKTVAYTRDGESYTIDIDGSDERNAGTGTAPIVVGEASSSIEESGSDGSDESAGDGSDYQVAFLENDDVIAMKVDGSDRRKLATVDWKNPGGQSLARGVQGVTPDERYVLLTESQAPPHQDLIIASSDGGGSTKVEDVWDPVLSPDGSTIAATGGFGLGPPGHVAKVMPVDGTSATELAGGKVKGFFPDGQSLLLDRLELPGAGADGVQSVVIVDLDGETTEFARGSGGLLSPDGEAVVYTDQDDVLYLQSIDSGDAEEIGRGSAVAFSEDGSKLLVVSDGRYVVLELKTQEEVVLGQGIGAAFVAGSDQVAIGRAGNRIDLVDASTGDRVKVLTKGLWADASPDGKVIQYGQGITDTSYRIIDVETGDEVGVGPSQGIFFKTD